MQKGIGDSLLQGRKVKRCNSIIKTLLQNEVDVVGDVVASGILQKDEAKAFCNAEVRIKANVCDATCVANAIFRLQVKVLRGLVASVPPPAAVRMSYVLQTSSKSRENVCSIEENNRRTMEDTFIEVLVGLQDFILFFLSAKRPYAV